MRKILHWSWAKLMGVCTIIVAAEEVRSGRILNLSLCPLTKVDICFVYSSCQSPDLFYLSWCKLALAPNPPQLVNSPLCDMAAWDPLPFTSTPHLSCISFHLAQGSVTVLSGLVLQSILLFSLLSSKLAAQFVGPSASENVKCPV